MRHFFSFRPQTYLDEACLQSHSALSEVRIDLTELKVTKYLKSGLNIHKNVERISVHCMNPQCATQSETNRPSFCVFFCHLVCFHRLMSCSHQTIVCCALVQPVVRPTPVPLGNLPMGFIPPSLSFSSPPH